MRTLCHLIAGLAVISLTACVSAHPIDLAADNPANPTAPSGFVETPTAFAGYKTGEDFAARAGAEANRAAGDSMMHMRDMPGMDHGNMSGMRHGGAPHGAVDQ